MNNQWVSVKERLPTIHDADENGKVLVYRNVNDSQKSLSKSIYDWHFTKHLDDDSYWMRLPEPPKIQETPIVFANAWGDTEPEYSLDDIKTINPEYEKVQKKDL